MTNPFTENQIRAMSDEDLDDRLMVACEHGDCYASGPNYPTSPMPWWTDPWAPIPRRKIKNLLGDVPRPWPPAYCSVGTTAQAATTAAGISYNSGQSARVNAENALVAINAATDLGS